MRGSFLILDIIFILGIVFFIILTLPKIVYYIYGIVVKKAKPLPKAQKNHKFAIIIPARNESAVIETLLKSLEGQTFDKNYYDVFIAVEDIKDPTCKIARDYGANIYVKQNFNNVGKGYVLSEVVDYIFDKYSKQKYEAFVIIDADNILSSNYLEKLNDALDAGYDIAVGNRNSKNWNGGWLAACTGLCFTRFSHFQNLAKAKYNATVMLSGTCYYVKTNIVKEFGGWKWYSLTEDVQLTTMSALHNYKSYYIDDAIFYDEQPTNLKASVNQRKRWVKGYLFNRSVYGNAIKKGVFSGKSNVLGCLDLTLGVSGMVSFATCFIAYLVGNFIIAMMNLSFNEIFFAALYRSLFAWVVYLFAMYIDTAILIFAENNKQGMKWYRKLEAIIMRPIYSMLYIPISVCAIFQKVEWLPIEHNVNTIEGRIKI